MLLVFMIQIKTTGVQAQAFSLIPDKLIARIAQEANVNRFHKKHDVNTVFKLVLFSHIMHDNVSLRVLEADSSSNMFQAFSNGMLGPDSSIPRSTIAYHLNKVPPFFLENLFEKLVEKYRKILFKGSKNNIKKLDTTYISCSIKLFNPEKSKIPIRSKNVVKATVLHGDLPEQIDYYFDQNLSDEPSFKAAIERYPFKKDDILVFDRGMQSRRSFVEIDNKNIKFITRLTSQASLKVIRKLDIPQEKSGDLRIISDFIALPSTSSRYKYKNEFRVIEAKNAHDDSLVFLTNCFHRTADEICRAYKQRWGIEIFFKFLKSYLNGRHFLARTKTGIINAYYLRLIAAILIAVVMHTDETKSFKLAKIALQKMLSHFCIYAFQFQNAGPRAPPVAKTKSPILI